MDETGQRIRRRVVWAVVMFGLGGLMYCNVLTPRVTGWLTSGKISLLVFFWPVVVLAVLIGRGLLCGLFALFGAGLIVDAAQIWRDARR